MMWLLLLMVSHWNEMQVLLWFHIWNTQQVNGKLWHTNDRREILKKGKCGFNNLKLSACRCENENLSGDYNIVGLEEDLVRLRGSFDLYLHDDGFAHRGPGMHRPKDAGFPHTQTHNSVKATSKNPLFSKHHAWCQSCLCVKPFLYVFIYSKHFTHRHRSLEAAGGYPSGLGDTHCGNPSTSGNIISRTRIDMSESGTQDPVKCGF